MQKYYELDSEITVSGITYSTLCATRYQNNDNLALILLGPHSPEDNIIVSVNIVPLLKNIFCLDVNAEWVLEAGKKLLVAGIIEDLDTAVSSGFVTYPVYRFCEELLQH